MRVDSEISKVMSEWLGDSQVGSLHRIVVRQYMSDSNPGTPSGANPELLLGV
jgi:hypothetical protein